MTGQSHKIDNAALAKIVGRQDEGFRAFVQTIDEKCWARYDLSAVRVGWHFGRETLARFSLPPDELAYIVAVLRDYAHIQEAGLVEAANRYTTADVHQQADAIHDLLREGGAADSAVTVQYDLSAVEVEGAIRDKLIEMGWTPPGGMPALTDDQKRVMRDPLGHIHRSDAWLAVWALLKELDHEAGSYAGTGQDCALETIRRMHQRASGAQGEPAAATAWSLLSRAATALDNVAEFPDSHESMQKALADAEDTVAEVSAFLHAHPAPAQQPSEDEKRLVRELDVLLNGEDGAAQQASLCDIVAQVRQQGIRVGAQGEPVGYAPPNWTLGMPVTIMATRRPGYPVPVYLHPQDHGHGVVYQILAIDGCWEDVSKERFERESLVNHKRILYTAPAQQPVSGADELQRLADQVVLANATSNPDLHHDAVAKLIAGVRNLRQPPEQAIVMTFADSPRNGLPADLRDHLAAASCTVPVLPDTLAKVKSGEFDPVYVCEKLAEYAGALEDYIKDCRTQQTTQASSRVVGREVSTEVCPVCDIAGCKHIRERAQSSAPQPAVPKALDPWTNNGDPRPDFDFRCGWNACRDTLLSAQPYQQRVAAWMQQCFGPVISADKTERNHRFLEEALELVQSLGCTADEAHALVRYVFGRPAGEPAQEVGGVRVTLSALCNAAGIDEQAAAEAELARISEPEMMDRIAEKQRRKPSMGPLPGVYPERTSRPVPGNAVVEVCPECDIAGCRHIRERQANRLAIWATQYGGKMPVLRGTREIAEANWYPEEGADLVLLVEADRVRGQGTDGEGQPS